VVVVLGRFRQRQRLDSEVRLKVRLVPQNVGKRLLRFLARQEQVAVAELATADPRVDARTTPRRLTLTAIRRTRAAAAN
jgi:hypothetical protein